MKQHKALKSLFMLKLCRHQVMLKLQYLQVSLIFLKNKDKKRSALVCGSLGSNTKGKRSDHHGFYDPVDGLGHDLWSAADNLHSDVVVAVQFGGGAGDFPHAHLIDAPGCRH